MRIRFNGVAATLSALVALTTVAAACGSASPTATSAPSTARPTTAPTNAATAGATAQPTAASTATARPTATSAPAPTATPAPVSSGEVVLVVGTLAYNLHPAAQGENTVLDALYTYMLGSDFEGKLEPASGFITSWTANSDANAFTFKVRDNMFFHNGEKATAQDAKYSLDFAADSMAKFAQGATYVKSVSKVEAPDDATLVVTLATPDLFWNVTYVGRNPPLPNNTPKLVTSRKHMTTVGLTEANKNPVGSGPYKFKSLAVGDRIVAEAVERHFYFGVPRSKTLTYVAVPEEATRLALLTNKTADLTSIGLGNAARARQSGLGIAARERGAAASIWNSQYPEMMGGSPNPLANETVRKALFWYGIDRKAIADSFLHGQGVPSMAYPVFSWDLGGFKSLPVPAFDVTRAKAMLAQAGYEKGFELDFYALQVTNPPGGEQIAEAVAVYWENLGIKVTRKPFTGAVFNQALTGVYDKNGFSKPTVYGIQFIANRQLSGPIALLQHDPKAIFSVNRDAKALELVADWLKAKNTTEYKQKGEVYQQYVYDHAASWAPLAEVNEIWAKTTRIPDAWQPGRDGSGTFRADYAAAMR